MEPPHHFMSPMRVLIKIEKSEPPTLDHPGRWSEHFNDFLKKCLVKDSNKRPSVEDLLKYPFVTEPLDKKPLVDLLSQADQAIKAKSQVINI